ncbi:hypothetical protein B0H34DRAFT_500899 [Crassisporium funariophilum]|nr:hypothetical protein B0H34DRAFT_500899 [Crassisporium funariophilum]
MDSKKESLDVPREDAEGPSQLNFPGANSHPRFSCGEKHSITDMPDDSSPPSVLPWFNVKPWKCGDPFQYPVPKNGDPWERSQNMVKDYDENMCNAWNDEVQNLLIFAGLFSAIATAFAIESRKLLQEDPSSTSTLLLIHIANQLAASNSSSRPLPPSTVEPFSVTHQAIRVNALIFVSVVLSLTTALVGILCMQWLREFRRRGNMSPKEYLALRQLKFEGLVKWKVPEMLSALPVLLQVALVLFLVGLVDFLQSIHPKLSIIVGVMVGLTVFFLLATTTLPAFFNVYQCFRPGATQCPYKSPQSWAFCKLVFIIPWIVEKIINTQDWHASANVTFNNLQSLFSSKNWLAVDVGLRIRSRGAGLEHSLAWMTETFTETVEAVQVIYHCFQSVDLIVSWNAYRFLTDLEPVGRIGIRSKEHDELQKELVLLAFLQYLDYSSALDQSSDLSQHRLELHARLMHAPYVGNAETLYYAGSFVSTLPGMFVIDLKIHEDVQMQIFNRLLELQRDSQVIDTTEWTILWSIVYRLLDNSSVSPDTRKVFMDKCLESMRNWMTSMGTPPNDALANFTSWAEGLCDQVVYPTWLNSDVLHPQLKQNLLEMTQHPDFLQCLDLLFPQFKICIPYPFWWNIFVEDYGLDKRYLILGK